MKKLILVVLALLIANTVKAVPRVNVEDWTVISTLNVKVYDFDIGIDLEKPPIDVMGTYTEKLDSGKRIQISGAVVMSWKIIRIDI